MKNEDIIDPERKFSIKGRVDVECKKRGFTKKECEGGLGTDAFVFVSILREGDDVHKGSKSFQATSRDGFDPDGGPIPDTELFQVIGYLAKHIAERGDVPTWQTDCCKDFMRNVRTNLDIDPTRSENWS